MKWSLCSQGKCNRENRCKFRHVNAMEYDMEMNAYQNRRRSNPFGYGYFEEDMMYERRGPGYSQERKRRCLTDMEGPLGSEGSPISAPPPHAFQMVQVSVDLNIHIGFYFDLVSGWKSSVKNPNTRARETGIRSHSDKWISVRPECPVENGCEDPSFRPTNFQAISVRTTNINGSWTTRSVFIIHYRVPRRI